MEVLIITKIPQKMMNKFPQLIFTLIVSHLAIGCHSSKFSSTEKALVLPDTTFADRFSFIDFSPVGESESNSNDLPCLAIIRHDGHIVEIQEYNSGDFKQQYHFDYTEGVARWYSIVGTNKEQAAIYFIYKPDTIFEFMLEFRFNGSQPLQKNMIDYSFPFPNDRKYFPYVRVGAMYLSNKIVSQSYGREVCIFRKEMLKNPVNAFFCNWDTKSTVNLKSSGTGPKSMHFRNERVEGDLPQLETGVECFEFDSLQSRFFTFPATMKNRKAVECR